MSSQIPETHSTAAHAKADSTSLGDLLGEVTRDLSTLIRQEIELAKAELKADVTRAGRAGGLLGGAAFAAYLVVVMVSFAGAWALAEVMAAGWAFLIVAAIWAVVGGFLFLRGRQQLSDLNFVPEQTVETLKEDVEWARNQKN